MCVHLQGCGALKLSPVVLLMLRSSCCYHYSFFCELVMASIVLMPCTNFPHHPYPKVTLIHASVYDCVNSIVNNRNHSILHISGAGWGEGRKMNYFMLNIKGSWKLWIWSLVSYFFLGFMVCWHRNSHRFPIMKPSRHWTDVSMGNFWSLKHGCLRSNLQ